MFSRKAADTLPEHCKKVNHYITLEEEASKAQLGHTPLYQMSDKELSLCKKYIKKNLSKGFITASSVLYAFSVLFVQKPKEELQFCVDYQKLNTMTRKD